MTIEVFEGVEQGSDQWKRLRAGVPTASEFANVLRKDGDAKTRLGYMRRLAGEIITGEPEETFYGPAMARGNAMEDEARDLYSLLTENDVRRVSFVKQFGAGASPDGLVGDDGGLELKSAKASVLIASMEKGGFPAEHVAQVQGNLWITGRKWWDLFVYCRGMPPFMKRVTPDAEYIERLAAAVKQFNDELAALVEKVRKFS